MNFKTLEIFTAVAKELNMTSVAKKFFISQPAVSQLLMQLEKDLGVLLFERMSKKIFLTAQGEIFFNYASKILETYNESRSVLNNDFKIRVGASTSIGIYIMPEIINSFTKMNGNTDISLKIDNTEKVIELLKRNQVDIAFIEGIIIDDELIREKTWNDKIEFICSKDSPLSNKSISQEKLSNEKFIIRERGSGTRHIIENILSENNVGLNIIYEFGNTEAIKKAVESNMGISAISRITIKDEIKSGRLGTLKVKGIILKRYFYLVIHKEKEIPKYLSDFCQFCRDFIIS